MRTTCGILLIDPKGKILICHPTRHHPNQWDIVKGQVDPDELKIDAMCREFLEETGLDLRQMCYEIVDYSEMHDIEFVYKHKKKKLHGFVGMCSEHIDVSYFRCTSMVTGYGDLPDFPEVDSFAWVNLSEYQLLHESQQEFLRHVYDNTEYLKNGIWEKQQKSHIYG